MQRPLTCGNPSCGAPIDGAPEMLNDIAYCSYHCAICHQRPASVQTRMNNADPTSLTYRQHRDKHIWNVNKERERSGYVAKR